MLLAVYNIIKYNIKYTHIMRKDKPHMLTFKPFTTLLNITLNIPTLWVKTAPYVDVEPSAVNRLCLSMRDVWDYYRVEDYHRVATETLEFKQGSQIHSIFLPALQSASDDTSLPP